MTPNMSQLCIPDRTDPSALKAVFYAEQEANYIMSVLLSQPGFPVIGLAGMAHKILHTSV